MEDVAVGPREILDGWDDAYLIYLDDEDYITVPAAERMRHHAAELHSGASSWRELDEAWPDWFALVEAFIVGHGLDDIYAHYEAVTFGGDQHLEPVTAADRAFLTELIVWLEMYLDQRRVGMDF